jgi:hypothetical protein
MWVCQHSNRAGGETMLKRIMPSPAMAVALVAYLVVSVPVQSGALARLALSMIWQAARSVDALRAN